MKSKIFSFVTTLLFAGNMACAAEMAGEFAGGAAAGAVKGLAPFVEDKAKGALDSVRCSAKKCSKGDSGTVNRCFMTGAAMITKNPHCANAYYNNFCKKGKGNQDACANIKEALGL